MDPLGVSSRSAVTPLSTANPRHAVARWLANLAHEPIGGIHLSNIYWFAACFPAKHVAVREFVLSAMTRRGRAIDDFGAVLKTKVAGTADAERIGESGGGLSEHVSSAITWATVFQHHLDNSSPGDVVRLGRLVSTPPMMMKSPHATIVRWLERHEDPSRAWYKAKATIGFGTDKVVHAYGWVAPTDDLNAALETTDTMDRASRARDLLGLVDWQTDATENATMMLIGFRLEDLPLTTWVARPGFGGGDCKRFAQRLADPRSRAAYEQGWGMTVDLAKVHPRARDVSGLRERVIPPTEFAAFKKSPTLALVGTVRGNRGDTPRDDDSVYVSILRDGISKKTMVSFVSMVVAP